MDNKHIIDTNFFTENLIDDILNQNIKTIRKTISLNNLQKKIQNGLSNPRYQRLYLRFQELSHRNNIELITDEEIRELLDVLFNMRKYELSMIFRELLIII